MALKDEIKLQWMGDICVDDGTRRSILVIFGIIQRKHPKNLRSEIVQQGYETGTYWL